MSTEDKFTTVRISQETRELFKRAALDKEVFWQTADRVIKEYLVSRLKR